MEVSILGVIYFSIYMVSASLINTIHPIAPIIMSPENVHKLMGFYKEV